MTMIDGSMRKAIIGKMHVATLHKRCAGVGSLILGVGWRRH